MTAFCRSVCVYVSTLGRAVAAGAVGPDCDPLVGLQSSLHLGPRHWAARGRAPGPQLAVLVRHPAAANLYTLRPRAECTVWVIVPRLHMQVAVLSHSKWWGCGRCDLNKYDFRIFLTAFLTSVLGVLTGWAFMDGGLRRLTKATTRFPLDYVRMPDSVSVFFSTESMYLTHTAGIKHSAPGCG